MTLPDHAHGTINGEVRHPVRALEVDVASGSVHLESMPTPSWVASLVSVEGASSVIAAAVDQIVDDLVRQPPVHWRGRRPLSPVEQLGAPVTELRDAIMRSLVVDQASTSWSRILGRSRVEQLIETPFGLFHAPVASITFSGCPTELHPLVAVRTADREGGDHRRATGDRSRFGLRMNEGPIEPVMLLAEADTFLAASVDRLSGPANHMSRRWIWGGRYLLSCGLLCDLATDIALAERLDVPVLTEQPWGLDLSPPGSAPVPGGFPAAIIVNGHFEGEQLVGHGRPISAPTLARALRAMTSYAEAEVIALATTSTSSSAALSYARMIANALQLPVVAGDGSAEVDTDGIVTSWRMTAGPDDEPSPAMWYLTVPGGSIPGRLNRRSLGSALIRA